MLEGLEVELKRRGDLFRNAGVDGLKAFREKTQAKMPRILLLVDESQEFFTVDDVLASKASQILDRLVRQGRVFGMHVSLESGTLAGAYTLARSTIDQMAVRIALQCSEADSRLILSEDNSAARLLSHPGEAIYNAANGLVEAKGIIHFRWHGFLTTNRISIGAKGKHLRGKRDIPRTSRKLYLLKGGWPVLPLYLS